MKRTIVALICLAGLAGCGADGEPVAPPAKPQPASAVAVSGTARVGVPVSRGAADLLAPVGAGG